MSSIQKQAKKYTKHNLLPLTFKMEVDKKTGKKDISKKKGQTMMPRGDYTDASQWEKYVLEQKLSNGQHDSLALKTGEKIDGQHRLVVVDVDTKPSSGNRAGDELMAKLCEEHDYQPHTWNQKSPHGYHIFYKVTEEDFSRLGTDTKVTYDGIKYDVDIRANNGLIFVYPTKYELNGQQHKYLWDQNRKYDDIDNLEIMPDWMVNVFSKEPRRIIPQRPFGEPETPIEEIHTLCSMIDDKHWDDRSTWVKLGTAMKSANDSEECAHLFDKYSGKSPKYRAGEPLRLWQSFDVSRVSKFPKITHFYKDEKLWHHLK